MEMLTDVPWVLEPPTSSLDMPSRRAWSAWRWDLARSGDDVAPRRPFLNAGELEDRHHGDVAVDRRNLDAQAVVAAFLPLPHLRILRGSKKLSGSSCLEHARRRRRQGGRKALPRRIPIDGRKRRGEDTVLLRHLVLPREHVTVEAPINADSTTASSATGRNRELRMIGK